MKHGGVRPQIAAWLVAASLLGCDASDTHPMKEAPVPGDRAAWRSRLGWPDACEQAFTASSAAKDDDGIEEARLADGRSLVAVRCAAGAYQPSYRYYLVAKAGASRGVPLTLPTFVSQDGETLSCSLEEEVWGEPTLLPDGSGLVVLSLARQTADCGSWARYAVADGRAELRELRAQVRCPAEIGEPVDPVSTEPPARWQALELHTRAGGHGCP